MLEANPKETASSARWWLPAVLVVTLATGAFVAWEMAARADREMREDLLAQTRLVAEAISLDHVRELSGTEADLTHPDYQRFKSQFAALQTSEERIRFVYLMGRKPSGEVFFLVDNEPAGSDDESPPGQIFSEAPEELRRVFDTREAAAVGPVTDRWGTWVSGFTPLVDPQAAASGLATPADAQAMVRQALVYYRAKGREGLLRAANDPKGPFRRNELYVYVTDRRMNLLAHPIRPELAGRNMLGEKDWAGGSYFWKEIRALADTSGSGWVQYRWEDPVSKRLDAKTAWIEAEGDLIVCAGAYETGSGAVAAVLGVDIAVGAWRTAQLGAALPAMLLTLALLVVALIAAGPARRCPRPGLAEAACALAVGLVLTLFITWTAHQGEQRSQRQTFAQLGASRTAAVAEALHNLRHFQLEGLAHFYENWPSVDADEFAHFAAHLEQNRAVRAWEWIPAVPAADRERFEAAARARGLADFDIWQKAAARTGMTAATEPITLDQGGRGMLIYRPVFETGGDRRLRGFALAVLDFDQLLGAAARGTGTLTEMYLLRDDGAAEPLASELGTHEHGSPLSLTRPLFFFGKTFALTAHPDEAFLRHHPARAGLVALLVGLFISAALAQVVALTVRRRVELERLVEDRTTELRASEDHLSATLRSIGDGVIACDAAGAVVSLNAAAEALTGWSTAEAAGKPIGEVFCIVNAMTRETVDDPVIRAIREGMNVDLANHTALIAKDGTERQIADSCAPIRDASGAVTGAVLVFRDVTEEYRRWEYQHAVADISARLLTVTADTQDEAIAFVLQRLGTLLGVDRGYVFGFSDDLARMANTHEWCAEGIEPQMERSQNMSTGAMPWWKGEITQNKPVHIPSVNGLPPEAQAEQAEFVAQGIQSLLSFPMIDQDGRLIGFMGFDAVRKACTWSEQAIAKLQLTADLLASAMGRNRALRELAESEEKFRQMGENMGEVFWLRSADTARMLYISPAYERVWGRSCQSLYEEPGSFVESIHEEDKPSVFKAYEEYSKTAVFDMEYRILRPDGEIRWVHARSFQVKNADGEITAHTGIATDITDRVLREQELDRAKKQTDQFFGQSLHGFFFCMLDEPIEWNAQTDKDRLLEYVLDHQRMTKVNQAMLDQYGATEEDFVGITVRELFQHDLDHAREIWRSLFDRGKWHVETHEQKLDGTPVIIDGDYICLYDEQGRITGHFGVQVDITERKRAEEQLCLQALVLDQITDRVTVTDLEGRIIYVNEAEVQALGYGRDELIGVSTEIFGDDPERGATQRDVVEQTLRNGEWHGEIVNQAVDGRELIVDCRTQLVRDSEENPVALCGVSTDITDRKRAERELLDTNRELENATARANQMAVKAEMANTAKSEFLANMSHEIRTPMNGVIGMADLLRTTSLDGQQRELIETITRSADHLLTVIDEILDLSKMEAGQLRLDLCPFDLKQLIEEVVDIIRPQADDAGIAIAMHYDLNAPEVFLGDAVRIRQVLLNLAGNAVKFTSEGSIEISAHMQNRCGDRTTMRLSVTDTGVGIPADKLVTVFDKFTQVDGSSTRNTGGAGLGLAISKQLVELMSGAISVTSRPGSGSTFRVDLPLQLDRLTAPAAAAQSNRPTGSSGPDLSVLVAEDNVVNQKVAQRILESLGCRVAMAADGRQAVAMVKASPFDLVFMDCQMPHMDGFEATAAIRCLQGAPAAVPIIAMTANAMKGDRERCLAAGMDDYVSKPIRRDTLAAVLDRWSGHLEHERERSATQTVP